jgi:urease accessory protein
MTASDSPGDIQVPGPLVKKEINAASPPSTPGHGQLHLTPRGFTTNLASYPLKLLTPSPLPSQPRNIHTAYTLAYGGGLVAGDIVTLNADIDSGCGLVLLTQGSTKVFKRRTGVRPYNIDGGDGTTRQRLNVDVDRNAFLLLMPDSVSPFRGSKYSQSQRFILPDDGSGSVLILDWVNSGRGQQAKGIGAEVWSMDSYDSTNEIWVGDKRIMRERTLLENRIMSAPHPAFASVATRLAPYNVYTTLFILGTHFKPLLQHLHNLADTERQFQVSRPADLIWSYSPVEDGKGGVLRLAGKEVEDLRLWLKNALDMGGVRNLVGEGLWPRII